MNTNFWQGLKVRLRGIEPSDADTFFRWNTETSRGQRLDFLWPPVSRECIREWVNEQARKKLEEDSFHWVIETLDHVPVGTIKAHNCDSRVGTFSQAFDIASEHRRKGFAKEAIWIVLRYYFRELRYQKVLNAVYEYNTESILLHEKLGFTKEGQLRRQVFSDGKYYDKLLFGMTLEEFDARS